MFIHLQRKTRQRSGNVNHKNWPLMLFSWFHASRTCNANQSQCIEKHSGWSVNVLGNTTQPRKRPGLQISNSGSDTGNISTEVCGSPFDLLMQVSSAVEIEGLLVWRCLPHCLEETPCNPVHRCGFWFFGFFIAPFSKLWPLVTEKALSWIDLIYRSAVHIKMCMCGS